MDDWLIDDDRLTLERKSLLPGTGFFVPDSLEEETEEQETREALAGAGTVVVADPDADGLACVALVREVFGEEPPDDVSVGRRSDGGDGVDGEAVDEDKRGADSDDSDARAVDRSEGDTRAADLDDGDGDEPDDDGVSADETPIVEATTDGRTSHEVALVPAGPHEIDTALEYVAEYAEPGAGVFVCDLAPDDEDDVASLPAVVDRAAEVRWFDHHQWEPAMVERVREAGVDLVVGDSDEECTADVALRSLDRAFPDRFRDLAAVTRDHDLWLREDPRSDDLADYAYWEDSETYVAVVRQHGADLPPEVEAYVAERRVEKDALVEKAVERAQLREVNGWTVGVTYGRCSQNEVAEALREAGADASVIVKPSGSASIRGTEAFERCHEVAAQVNGGGHPKAAGCKPDVYEDMLDYAHHWTTRGAVTKQAILDAFRTLEPEDDEGVETER
jgi:oligoribonuclease NrnB/cAMP/cGMP phosphodiesterase (DHH superfamily)